MTHPARILGRTDVAVPPEELPGDPGSLLRDASVFLAEHRTRLLRLGLHLVVAALPLLAISAHVFGVAPMNVTAGLVVVPLVLVVLLLAVFAPIGEDRIVLLGVVWGVAATLVYDAVRLDTVYLLGWWGDFIPTVGTWILGADGDATPVGAVGAVIGYAWRYVGDGGGIGVAFFVLAAATGLRRWGERATVAAAVVFAVFPVWTGLIATVAVAPRGERLMFPLTVPTVALSLLGHLVFGLVLGLGCARCRGLEECWPWPPLLDRPWAHAPRSAPTRRAGGIGGADGSGGAGGTDGGWGPPALAAGPAATVGALARAAAPGHPAVPEAPGEITEIRVERPVPRRQVRVVRSADRSGAVRAVSDPPSVPVAVPAPVAAWSGAVPVRREPVSGPVRVVGASCEHPLRSVPRPAAAPAPASGPRSGPLPVGREASPPSGPFGPAPGPVSSTRPGGPATSGPARPSRPAGPIGPVEQVGPVGSVGTSVSAGPPSGPVPVDGGAARLASTATGRWSRAAPPDGPDPWLGVRRLRPDRGGAPEPRQAATGCSKAHPPPVAPG